jgi:hypothetical protein
MQHDLEGHLIFAFGAFGIVGFLCWTLWTGEIPIRGGPTYTRENNPGIYWTAMIVLALFGVIFVPIALSLLFGGSGVGPK